MTQHWLDVITDCLIWKSFWHFLAAIKLNSELPRFPCLTVFFLFFWLPFVQLCNYLCGMWRIDQLFSWLQKEMYIYVLIRKMNTFVTGLCVNETLYNEVVGRMKCISTFRITYEHLYIATSNIVHSQTLLYYGQFNHAVAEMHTGY